MAHLAGVQHLFAPKGDAMGKAGLNAGGPGFVIAGMEHQQARAVALKTSDQGSGEAAKQGGAKHKRSGKAERAGGQERGQGAKR
ncbi:MAG: hypothetical protein CME61_09385 [Halobacteriovoraceae bacterium]|nr:hypothetical protein [Halobacteriovoraceae bacterium]